jgi:DNA repair photolyase
VSNDSGRYEAEQRVGFDDGWGSADESLPPLRTTVATDDTRSIIARNDSPDVPFDRSINPYRGCEHGCIYCFARPTHAYLGLSPGQDFESRLYAKPRAAELLAAELSRPGYRCGVIALGANTDPYQPIERRFAITRQILETLGACEHPVSIVTKSNLVLRDLDLLAGLAERNLVSVYLSLTTLDRQLARRMEPRAPTPERRLEAVRALCDRGVPVGVLLAPLIPGLSDHELERLLAAAAQAGARSARYLLVRLPLEIKDLFREWLEAHYPGRAGRVLSLIRSTRGGALYDPRFGTRMRGEGPHADLIARRFAVFARRHQLDAALPPLDTSRFRPPRAAGGGGAGRSGGGGSGGGGSGPGRGGAGR